MKHFWVVALAILCLTACNQHDSELGRATAVQTAETDSVAHAITPVPDCRITTPEFLPTKQPIADASLSDYLQNLRQAVKTLDENKLQQLLDPNIKTSFGGDGGWSSFSAQWHPEQDSAEIWILLERLLRLGGDYPLKNNADLYALPYVYSNWPDSLDAFAHAAVTGTGAILKQEPSETAASICVLGQVTLRVNAEKSYPQQQTAEKEWWYAQTLDGSLSGYLNHTQVHSPIGYRAILNKNKQGQWLMTALVSGD
ncbi:hypothetical protein [Pontibacter oryzae]|uniref:SH3 domain-containing protein n=1 Tax=Pontibacter oryzae TaxID=2304593 RepID=A0A399SFQ3_9BACT|nr:hypothetical protein [Pontibacter oryzae]RIJ42976.1 hypothetical protein D1627_03835 [Pontibacter oryzae]